jgi:hypothetical protein
MLMAGWRLSEDSQIRSTVQPRSRKIRFTVRSRSLLPRIFAAQNARLEVGIRARVGCPCQKSPSTKTASPSQGNTKSGWPGSLLPRRHPRIPPLRMRTIKRISVEALPRARIADITSDLLLAVKTSAILNNALYGLLVRFHLPARASFVFLAYPPVCRKRFVVALDDLFNIMVAPFSKADTAEPFVSVSYGTTG